MHLRAGLPAERDIASIPDIVCTGAAFPGVMRPELDYNYADLYMYSSLRLSVMGRISSQKVDINH
jgi:hypothetical protein